MIQIFFKFEGVPEQIEIQRDIEKLLESKGITNVLVRAVVGMCGEDVNDVTAVLRDGQTRFQIGDIGIYR